MAPHKSDACRKAIETLLEYDMIEPSKSPWACGVVMAKKKGDQLRFCCDFRYLNSVTVKDAYPIPGIDESLSKFGDAKFFTTLDLGSAFWQVTLRKQERDKTGFACELGLFQWKRMPFGLCKKTSPQAYVKESVKRQQKLNELCRRNTAQAQMRQRKKYAEKILQAKPYAVGQYVWVFQNVIPPKGTKKLFKKWRGPFMITEVHQQGRFYRLSTWRAAHYENLKPHVPSPEDWCVPQNKEGLEYLLVEPACEVNEKGTRE